MTEHWTSMSLGSKIIMQALVCIRLSSQVTHHRSAITNVEQHRLSNRFERGAHLAQLEACSRLIHGSDMVQDADISPVVMQ